MDPAKVAEQFDQAATADRQITGGPGDGQRAESGNNVIFADIDIHGGRTVTDAFLRRRGHCWQNGPRERTLGFPGRSGGMADATDSKSVARKGVWVQVPPPALIGP